ncbi:MAG: citrate synthase [Victivallaceae bacterium]|nr:citrate synthase [Victivallaceae bacterium]
MSNDPKKLNNKYAELKYNGTVVKLPIVIGTEGEVGIDIADLRRTTGMVTIDPSFLNTAVCYSKITYVNGEKGILHYRGISVDQLVEDHRFVETAYLLLRGKLPKPDQIKRFSLLLTKHSLLHEDMRHFFDRFPRTAHPMQIMSSMFNALSTFYPNVDSLSMREDVDLCAARLISTFRTMAAFAYKRTIGEPVIYPRSDLPYCANFLNMMFSSPVHPYEIKPEVVKILNTLLILHADHEQNCSTTAVRTVGSAQVNLYSTISAGISALSGPLHGGANQAVIDMLKRIVKDGNVKKYIDKAKDKNSSFRLMGFGHRVYKTFDPRAVIIKKACHDFLKAMNIDDPLLEVALHLEEVALKDEYFVERNLYPNVDFYSGIIYRAIGIPEDMFTVMFALARMPGWIAHWKEMTTSNTKITRPRQIYIGKTMKNES